MSQREEFKNFLDEYKKNFDNYLKEFQIKDIFKKYLEEYLLSLKDVIGVGKDIKKSHIYAKYKSVDKMQNDYLNESGKYTSIYNSFNDEQKKEKEEEAIKEYTNIIKLQYLYNSHKLYNEVDIQKIEKALAILKKSHITKEEKDLVVEYLEENDEELQIKQNEITDSLDSYIELVRELNFTFTLDQIIHLLDEKDLPTPSTLKDPSTLNDTLIQYIENKKRKINQINQYEVIMSEFKTLNYQLFLIFEQFQIDTNKKGGHCIPQIYLRLE
jgi:hypothetical protein